MKTLRTMTPDELWDLAESTGGFFLRDFSYRDQDFWEAYFKFVRGVSGPLRTIDAIFMCHNDPEFNGACPPDLDRNGFLFSWSMGSLHAVILKPESKLFFNA